ncbi:uncharacterized protein [Linepithema humile]|uniref:uncharacterized protein n=1 Tax=Linepithema humile TaxID=83485 RepID=UPI0006234698|nr:PREDICTED: uncharacterized protein LOC105677129 [Linepithema humile]XP_012230952.1 PREDICTED: uncharacterized protein LOC105677129 [Linepithema humile]XP_012230953.1 PREDICTED: uncharacterized protein LOC105677129 [Linepithema humile]XP_012230954.1 PREDICTED: uncharacterized protein LOC105677129 [Linepithema humile]
MTENVYVIKVKTKPPLSSLYPSERRYSASTIGGLSLVHFGLGALSLLLGTFALSLQGPILSVACLVPFVTGLLAWRRWYIDRNITIFFYGSLFSLVVAVLCFVVTILDVAAVSGSTEGSLWSLEKILDAPRYSLHPAVDLKNDTHVDDITPLKNNSLNDTENQDFLKINESNKSSHTESNVSDFHDETKIDAYDDLKAEASFTFEERTMISRESFQSKDTTNITQGPTKDLTKEETKTFWRSRYENSPHTKMLLTLNVLVASLLEIFWSLLSAKIAFRGMMNRLPENGNVVTSLKTTRLPVQKRKPPAPKPDILDHDRRLSESLQNFTTLQSLAGSGSRLPLPESSREFRERVERFLANQETQRVVEGA